MDLKPTYLQPSFILANNVYHVMSQFQVNKHQLYVFSHNLILHKIKRH